MGEVIQLQRASRLEQPGVPRIGDLQLEPAELDWLAQRAGEIAHRRAFTGVDFHALVRALSLGRAMKALANGSRTDRDLADEVARRRSEILAGLRT